MIEKNFESGGWRPKICKYFEISITTIYTNSERQEQFLKQNAFLTCFWRFLRSNILIRIIIVQIRKNDWDLETYRKSLKNLYLINVIFLWFLAVLNEDGAIVFGDIRPDRGSSDSWILQGRTSTILPLVRILIIK